jgi:hypothetical protein
MITNPPYLSETMHIYVSRSSAINALVAHRPLVNAQRSRLIPKATKARAPANERYFMLQIILVGVRPFLWIRDADIRMHISVQTRGTLPLGISAASGCRSGGSGPRSNAVSTRDEADHQLNHGQCRCNLHTVSPLRNSSPSES